MKFLLSCKAVMIVALGLSAPGAASAGFNLFSSYWGNVIVSTDTSEEGRALTPPTPAKPVYYLGRSLGCRLGSISGDQMPDVKEMNRFIAKILARQGYVGARPGVHEPTLYLVVQWGYLWPGSEDILWFLGYDPKKDIAAPVFPTRPGPEVYRRNARSPTIETILTNASGANYGIIITAFEYQSVSTPEPVIYWQTRIALPAQGKSMSEALPTMLVAAGTAIGREADSPVLVSADDARKGRVEFGELEVIGQEVPPPLDSGAAGTNK